MPMENVQLYRGHAVKIAQDYLDGHPVPRDVQMQSAPRETGMVFDIDCRQFLPLWRGDNKLSKCFKAAQYSQRIRSGQERPLRRDLKVVALVFTEFLNRCGRMVALDHKRCGSTIRSYFAKPANRILQARLRVAGNRDTDRRADREASL